MADIYDDLCERILCAQEEMLKHEIEANTVILNGKKYGALFKSGYRPSIFGMAAECERLPDDWDFIVQYREPKLATNADRIRAMSDEELAEFIGGIYTLDRDVWGAYDPCIVVEGVKIRDEEDMLEWLQSPAGEVEG